MSFLCVCVCSFVWLAVFESFEFVLNISKIGKFPVYNHCSSFSCEIRKIWQCPIHATFPCGWSWVVAAFYKRSLCPVIFQCLRNPLCYLSGPGDFGYTTQASGITRPMELCTNPVNMVSRRRSLQILSQPVLNPRMSLWVWSKPRRWREGPQALEDQGSHHGSCIWLWDGLTDSGQGFPKMAVLYNSWCHLRRGPMTWLWQSMQWQFPCTKVPEPRESRGPFFKGSKFSSMSLQSYKAGPGALASETFTVASFWPATPVLSCTDLQYLLSLFS